MGKHKEILYKEHNNMLIYDFNPQQLHVRRKNRKTQLYVEIDGEMLLVDNKRVKILEEGFIAIFD